MNEHAKAIFNEDTKNDALAAHKANCACSEHLEKTQVIAVEPVWYRRKVREALEIRRLHTGPSDDQGRNEDLGDYVTTSSWNNLFTQINADPRSHVQTFESLTSIWRQVDYTIVSFFVIDSLTFISKSIVSIVQNSWTTERLTSSKYTK